MVLGSILALLVYLVPYPLTALHSAKEAVTSQDFGICHGFASMIVYNSRTHDEELQGPGLYGGGGGKVRLDAQLVGCIAKRGRRKTDAAVSKTGSRPLTP